MFRRAGCRFAFAWLATAASVLVPAYPVHAVDTEYREFSIFVDGKEAGFSKMTLVTQDDGTVFMSASVDVKFRQLIVDYSLKIETKEWWKNGRLIGMETKSTENGKKTDVVVATDNNQLRMKVNGLERAANPEAWPNSYWKLADARFHNKKVPILESDNGKEFVCDLKYIDMQQIKVGTQLQECYHFRVTGGSAPVELWFDRYHRLVRQEFTEAGHKTIVQLLSVRR